MCHCIKNPCSLKLRRYAARLIDLNEYLASFPQAIMVDKMGVTKLNGIILTNMKNICLKQAYVQGFECGNISFKKAVSMFESMEISESIYECVVTPYY